MWSAGQRQLSSDQLDTDANNAKKDLKLVSTLLIGYSFGARWI